ncbi:hypothetical protein NC652_041512 [Populus alba x Populus x berolinensis]|nr:hypothetical protein NC652_041512 [Populus alba x Populus x berolinensis]
MFLRRLKHKAKLLSSSGSLHSILKMNVRWNPKAHWTLESDKGIFVAEVQGTLKTGQALGFGMLRTCRCWQHPLEARWTESWKIGMTTNNAILQLDSGYVLPSFLMKILLWNSCGLGMSAKGVSIRNIVLHNDIEVCFLLGTKRAMCCDNFVHAL